LRPKNQSINKRGADEARQTAFGETRRAIMPLKQDEKSVKINKCPKNFLV
jgi:hypothetical protein